MSSDPTATEYLKNEKLQRAYDKGVSDCKVSFLAYNLSLREDNEKLVLVNFELRSQLNILKQEKEHLGLLLEHSWKAGAEALGEVERLSKLLELAPDA